MISALRKNYGKTLWITRLILAVSILFGDLFSISTFFGLMAMMGLQVQGTVAGCVIRDSEEYMPYYNKFVLKK